MPPNYRINLPVCLVTPLAKSASVAPRRPAGYAERWAIGYYKHEGGNKPMRRLLLACLATLTAAIVSDRPAVAGPYGDDLSKCLVSSTGDKDKADLVRWVFAAISVNPDVSGYVSVSEAQKTELSRTVAALFERLLTKNCHDQYRDAAKYEGDQALVMSFGVLGQVAMRGLMENPAVNKYIGDLDNYVDKEKINAVAHPKEP